MKYLSLLLLIVPGMILAQEPVKVPSKINEVTVFRLGAEVSRKATINMQKGVNELLFEDLSPGLDEKSIQFKAKGDFTILSLRYEVRFNERTQAKIDQAARINEQLEAFSDQVKHNKDRLAISVNEEQVLLANTDFDVWEGMNVAQLAQGVDLVRDRLTEIKKRKRELRKEIDDLNQQRQKLLNELQAMRIEDAKPMGVVLVKLKSEATNSMDAGISYVVADAGWEPYYDIRVTDIAKPLLIEYKAKVRQTTGEDWNKVKLTLSTGNPYEGAALPELNPWFLNFVSRNYNPRNTNNTANPQTPGSVGVFKGLVIDTKTGEAIPFANVVALDSRGAVVAGTSTDLDGNYVLQVDRAGTRLEVSMLGYNKYSTSLQNPSIFQTIRMSTAAETLEEVVVTYDAPLTQVAGEATDAKGSVNVRGARPEGTVYFVNGVKMRSNIDLPQAAIAETEIVTGGLPAQYGSASGGTLNSRYKIKYDENGWPIRQPQFRISQNPVNLKFEVDIAYDIPADGEDYKVSISSVRKPADYLYRAVPKLNEHAFLTATMSNWEELNLLNGAAGIYLEGVYLGEAYLNAEQAGDTLEISLGKDENIVVRRSSVKQVEGTRFFSNKREDRFQYEIKVRNNKAVPLQLEIIDQYPVSGNDDITVNRIEHSEGKVDDEIGIINWEFELQPKEEKVLNLIYSIRYPKGRYVNTR